MGQRKVEKILLFAIELRCDAGPCVVYPFFPSIHPHGTVNIRQHIKQIAIFGIDTPLHLCQLRPAEPFLCKLCFLKIRPAMVAADRGVACMQARHQYAPARRTDRGARVAPGKTRSVSRQRINVTRSYSLLAITTQIRLAQIIGHDIDDVGPIL